MIEFSSLCELPGCDYEGHASGATVEPCKRWWLVTPDPARPNDNRRHEGLERAGWFIEAELSLRGTPEVSTHKAP